MSAIYICTDMIGAVISRLVVHIVCCLYMPALPPVQVRSAAARIAAARGAHILQVELGFAELLEPHQIVAAVQEAVQSVRPGRLKLAILDHVISFPPVVLPVQDIAHVCSKVGCTNVVLAQIGLMCMVDF